MSTVTENPVTEQDVTEQDVTPLSSVLVCSQAALDLTCEKAKSSITQFRGRWLADLKKLISQDPARTPSWRASLTALYAKLRQSSARQGFEHLRAELERAYQGSDRSAADLARVLGLHSVRINRDALAALRAIDVARVVRVSDEATAQLAEGITRAAIAGASRKKILEQMEKILDAEFQRYATTYVDTGLRAYDRSINWQVWTAGDIKSFRYSGPLDQKTREWCRDRVGKTFTREEILDMENDTDGRLPVYQYGGGYSCRHTWVPIVKRSAAGSRPATYGVPRVVVSELVM